MTADPKPKASGVTLRTVTVTIAVVTAPIWVFLLAFSALPAVLALSGDPRIVTYAGTVVPPWAANRPGVLSWTAAVATVARRVK